MDKLLEFQTNFIDDLRAKGKSANTIKNYQADLRCFNKFLQEKGKNLKLNEFNDTQVREYGSYIEKAYSSPNSRRRRVQALRLFFDYLVSKGAFHENPIKKVMVSPKVVEAPNPPSFATIRDVYELLANETQSNEAMPRLIGHRNLLIFYFIYGAGLKVSDIAILKRGHIHFFKGRYRVMVSHPKRDPYTILLPEGFNSIYQSYVELLETQKNNDQIDFDDVLFNANPFKILSGGISPRGLEIIYQDISKKVGAKITAKSLRQACIFKWIGQEHPQSSIKEWMGVQPIYSLKPYSDLFKEDPAKYHFAEIGDL